jgi:hypothetical protein
MIRRRRLLCRVFIGMALVVGGRPAYAADGVGFGAKIGPLFPSVSSDTLKSFDNHIGWMGGIWIGGNQDGTYGAQVDVLYAKKNIPDALLGRDTELHYLEIPILLRINFGSTNRDPVAGYIIGGESFDVKLKAALNGVDIGSQYNGIDLGFIAGGGVEISRFIVEGRYNWGLRSFVSTTVPTATKIKTRTFAILFGVRFN